LTDNREGLRSERRLSIRETPLVAAGVSEDAEPSGSPTC
jgi:hypothetical protein